VAANVRTIQGTARLDFDTSSAVLAPDRGRNPGELAAITDAVVRTGATRIIGITVTGYSSPDGRSETNAALARDRAAALGRYLQEMYRLPANAVVVRGEGEDWVGLRGMVGASSLPYISEILKVIDSSSAPDAKESLMRRMMGGQIWQRMEREIFPELRKVDYTIEYEAAQ
jgi:hypothetical protein